MLQLGFYGLAFIGWRNEHSGEDCQRALFRIPLYLCISNLAAMVACIKYVTGSRQELWESSKR
jgi:hypothetical protein